ncbi:MAG: GMP/IMP nucleotidase [Gammaproteobacteria bacterium]|nr:GMP/IMP nucleotidase [Gammaproteobacteria bacterium]
MIDWTRIDTVMLDMDGCLLDLHYDNCLWNELVPARYGQAQGISADEARQRLYGHLLGKDRDLEFYCIDFWTRRTGLDIAALHHELAHLVDYRPGAAAFLDWLRGRARTLLVTNAHRASLAVKDRYSGLSQRLDGMLSSHDFGAPKESGAFWDRLPGAEPFDPARTLFIDDTRTVLDAANDHGIGHLLTISQPDSGRPPRDNLEYPAFNDFNELIEHG